jgi:hypothetical protein
MVTQASRVPKKIMECVGEPKAYNYLMINILTYIKSFYSFRDQLFIPEKFPFGENKHVFGKNLRMSRANPAFGM